MCFGQVAVAAEEVVVGALAPQPQLWRESVMTLAKTMEMEMA